MQQLIERITIDDHQIDITLNRSTIAATLGALDAGEQNIHDPIVVTIEAQLKRSGKGKRLIIENGVIPDINVGVVELLKEAFNIRYSLISESSDDSIEAMSQRLRITRKGYLTALVRLSYLAPNIVRALVEGRHPVNLSSTKLLKLSKDLPHNWSDQRQFLGF